MVTIPAGPRTFARTVPTDRGAADDQRRTGWKRVLYVARGLLGAMFDAELVLPEADPDQVRALLIELGRLDATAGPALRGPALAAFQHDNGLPATGTADGRTVSALAAAVREENELRELGLA
ncbi:peptidoglycan-binding domain-containing protein [Nocardiopsis sediminis]|uniref:Peptidoglycan-binding domain-containing protein n=1 Tax=Nocardiopsis sediminis TaxID=1778267 RepID=A0ABV8FRJ8_9ACTN